MLTVAEGPPEVAHGPRIGGKRLGESLMLRLRKARRVEQFGERRIAEHERLAKHIGGAQRLQLRDMPGNLLRELGTNTIEGNGGCQRLRLDLWRQTENHGSDALDQWADQGEILACIKEG